MARTLIAAVLALGIAGTTETLGQVAPVSAHPAPCSTLARCRAQLARAREAVRWNRAVRRHLARALHWQRLHRSGGPPGPWYALRLAAAFTGAPLGVLTCIADGETGGTFDPAAYNRSGASGLFQFMPGSWSSMGVPGFPATDPLAAALAAARQVALGNVSPWRGGEERCWS